MGTGVGDGETPAASCSIICRWISAFRSASMAAILEDLAFDLAKLGKSIPANTKAAQTLPPLQINHRQRS
jgi:hypothetical protein